MGCYIYSGGYRSKNYRSYSLEEPCARVRDICSDKVLDVSGQTAMRFVLISAMARFLIVSATVDTRYPSSLRF